MAKKGTLGYKAELMRRKAQRRLEQLNKVLSNTNTSARIREWASAQKREIKSAMQGTRMYSKEGKRYKSKTTKYIEQQISRLEMATEKTLPRLSTEPTERQQRINSFTQRQINLASIKPSVNETLQPSIYTREEVSVFYRATQKIWQKPGISLEDRNKAILDYYNEERLIRGLAPITLKDIIDKVVESNWLQINAAEVKSSLKTGDTEYDKMIEETMAQQNESGKTTSPTSGISHSVIDSLEDLLNEQLIFPKPTDI